MSNYIDTFFKNTAPHNNLNALPEQQFDSIALHVNSILQKLQKKPNVHESHYININKLLQPTQNEINIQQKIKAYQNTASYIEHLFQPGIELSSPPISNNEMVNIVASQLNNAIESNPQNREDAAHFYTNSSGILPYKYDTNNQGDEKNLKPQNAQNERPNNMLTRGIPESVYKHLYSGVYNSIQLNGQQFPLNLRHEINTEKLNSNDQKPITELTKRIENYITTETKQGRLLYIVPFVNEKESMVKTLKYLTELGVQVITPNAVTDETLEKNRGLIYGKKMGAEYFAQHQELKNIDWKHLLKQCGLGEKIVYNTENNCLQDMHGGRVGTKGATILAAMMRVLSDKNVNKQANIVFHDSDIINPNDYMAAHYLAWATMNDTDSIATLVAKSGLGRNNENSLNAVMNTLKTAKSEKVKLLCAEMLKLVWPHTGERRMRLDYLEHMPVAVGMDIEQIFNIYAAGLAAHNITGGITQTLNPHPKNECANSSYSREMNQMKPLADSIQNLLMFLDKKDKYLHELTPQDYVDFNKYFALKPSANAYANIESQSPVEPVAGVFTPLLPPYSVVHKHYYSSTK